jgi:hypothetical protein
MLVGDDAAVIVDRGQGAPEVGGQYAASGRLLREIKEQRRLGPYR